MSQAKSRTVGPAESAERVSAGGYTPSSLPYHRALTEGCLIARRYRLVELVGAGAMGEVWRARHEELRTDVAVKFAPRARDGMCDVLEARFRLEAQVAAKIGQRTKHVVAVHDAGRHDGIPFLVMEMVEGVSLEMLLRRGMKQTAESVANMLEQLAEALEVAHAEGVWHRDIKPDNIMMSDVAGDPIFKLTDFGVAKALDETADFDLPRQTSEGLLVGTPAYMSPEQITGHHQPTASSDLWSLAVVAYEMLTLRMPFWGDTTKGMLLAICTGEYEPASHFAPLPRAADAFFERAFAVDPGLRFPTARSLAFAFRTASGVVDAAGDFVASGVIAADDIGAHDIGVDDIGAHDIGVDDIGSVNVDADDSGRAGIGGASVAPATASRLPLEAASGRDSFPRDSVTWKWPVLVGATVMLAGLAGTCAFVSAPSASTLLPLTAQLTIASRPFAATLNGDQPSLTNQSSAEPARHAPSPPATLAPLDPAPRAVRPAPVEPVQTARASAFSTASPPAALPPPPSSYDPSDTF